MPYKSEAQRRKFHADPKLRPLARKWDKEEEMAKNYTPIFKSANSDFNHRAAREAYDLVMKMDDDSAEMFVRMIASEVLEETISKNLRTLQAHLDKVANYRMEKVRKILISKAVDNPEMAQPYAQAFAEIAKARQKNPYDYGYVFQESDFRRDPSTGQFRAKVTHQQRKPLRKETAHTLGVRGLDDDHYKNLKNPTLQAQYQDEYRQLAQFLRNVHQSTDKPGDTDVYLHFRAKNPDGSRNPNGEVWVERQEGTKVDRRKINPKEHDLIGVEARPGNLTLGGAAFGLTTALGNPGTSPGAAATYRGLNEADRRLKAGFADDWMAAADPHNPNLRTYGRVKQGSELVSDFAPVGSKAAIAAEFGRFVGEHGPEAEKVFGPSTRKAAYRYRGVTKKPDEALVSEYQAALRSAKRASLTGSGGGEASIPRRSAETAARRTAQTRAMNKYLEAEAERTGKPMDAIRVSEKKRAEIMNAAVKAMPVRAGYTDEEIGAGRGVVLNYLFTRKNDEGRGRGPEARLYNLQLASGNTPPSEGVVIDSKGKIVSQSIGYGDDHYLPFNLKQLKGLKGGEYIRTRSVGGPTSEDIYTGLMSGAKKLTVVSRSGTFTVEFESDFKGGRRYNDKALRMTKRYQQLLDAVQSEQVDKEALNPTIRNGIIEEVRQEWPGESPAVLSEKVKERINEFKAHPELSSKDEKLANFMAVQRARATGGDRDSKEFMREVTNEIAREKEFKFRLNGPGYAAALDALREQFPYYISVNHVTSRENEENLQRDRGYVEPGRIRPTEAMGAGLYGTKLNQGLKRKGLEEASASRMHYQDRGGKARAGVEWEKPKPAAAEDKPAEGTEGKDADGKAKSKEDKIKDAMAQARERRAHSVMALDLYDAVKEANIDPGDVDILKLDRGVFKQRITTIEGREGMKEAVEALEKLEAKLPQKVKTALQQYKRGAGGVEAKEFEKELALDWPNRPFTFNYLSAYKDSDTPETKALRVQEVKKINERTKSISYGVPLSELEDDQMAQEISDLREAYQVLKDNPDIVGDSSAAADLRKEIRQAFLKDADPEAANHLLQGGTDRLLSHMEDVHKMRRLKQLGGWTEEEIAGPKPPKPDPTKDDILSTVEQHFKNRESLKTQVGNYRKELEDIPNDVTLTTEEENLLQYVEALEDTNMDGMDVHEVTLALSTLAERGHNARLSRARRPWES